MKEIVGEKIKGRGTRGGFVSGPNPQRLHGGKVAAGRRKEGKKGKLKFGDHPTLVGRNMPNQNKGMEHYLRKRDVKSG